MAGDPGTKAGKTFAEKIKNYGEVVGFAEGDAGFLQVISAAIRTPETSPGITTSRSKSDSGPAVPLAYAPKRITSSGANSRTISSANCWSNRPHSHSLFRIPKAGFQMVPGTGVEPVRGYPSRDFKSLASASSATRARMVYYCDCGLDVNF